jgi:hypothetical protein
MGIADCGMRNEKSGIKNWLADFGFADSPPRLGHEKSDVRSGENLLDRRIHGFIMNEHSFV